MPKNKSGGNKAKRGANKFQNAEQHTEIQRPLDDRQKYGVVTKILGNCRFEVDTDGTRVQLSLPGKLRGRRGGRITLGTAVLYDCGDLSEGQGGYVICIYNDYQSKTLCKEGLISTELMDETKKIDSLFGESDIDFTTLFSNTKEKKPKEETPVNTIISTKEIDLDTI